MDSSPAVVLSAPHDRLLRRLTRVSTLLWPVDARDTTCSICYVEFQPRDDLLRHEDCGSIWHLDCLLLWLRNTCSCPLCRGCTYLSALCLHPQDHLPVQSLSTVENRLARSVRSIRRRIDAIVILAARATSQQVAIITESLVRITTSLQEGEITERSGQDVFTSSRMLAKLYDEVKAVWLRLPPGAQDTLLTYIVDATGVIDAQDARRILYDRPDTQHSSLGPQSAHPVPTISVPGIADTADDRPHGFEGHMMITSAGSTESLERDVHGTEQHIPHRAVRTLSRRLIRATPEAQRVIRDRPRFDDDWTWYWINYEEDQNPGDEYHRVLTVFKNAIFWADYQHYRAISNATDSLSEACREILTQNPDPHMVIWPLEPVVTGYTPVHDMQNVAMSAYRGRVEVAETQFRGAVEAAWAQLEHRWTAPEHIDYPPDPRRY